MKTKFILFSLLFFQLTNAQNIVFADANFKALLVDLPQHVVGAQNLAGVYGPIDTNADGQISVTEASNISSLYIAGINVVNVQGIEFFTNLKNLTLFTDLVPTYNLSGLVNLENLTIGNQYYYGSPTTVGAMTSINLSNNINLEELYIETALLTNLDLSNNVKLDKLTLFQEQAGFTTNLSNMNVLRELIFVSSLPVNLDLSLCPGLLNLTAQGAGFTSLDLSNQTILNQIYLTSTNLTTINFSNNISLENVFIGNNLLLETIDFGTIKDVYNLSVGNSGITSLNLNNLIFLDYLIIDGCPITDLQVKNIIRERGLILTNVPLLQNVCTDDTEIIRYKNVLNNIGMFNVNVDSACNQPTLLRPNVTMYPNPVVDMLNMATNVTIDRIEIYNINSVQMMADTSGNSAVNIQSLTPGMYFLKVFSGNDVTNMKFIKS